MRIRSTTVVLSLVLASLTVPAAPAAASFVVTAPLYGTTWVVDYGDCHHIAPVSEDEGWGTVILTRTDDVIDVDVTAAPLTRNEVAHYAIEAWEHPSRCGGPPLATPDLTVGEDGVGTGGFTLTLPAGGPLPGEPVLGDGIGTEKLVVAVTLTSPDFGWGFILSTQPIPVNPGDDLVPDFTAAPERSGRDMGLDASASRVPVGVPVTYRWDFDNDGADDAEGLVPHWTDPEPGPHDVKLTIVAGDRSADTVKQVKVPYDTVVVLLNGIDPTGLAPDKDADEWVAAPGAFQQLLYSLGCAEPWTGAITRQCNDQERARLFWSPYSYLGPDGSGPPLPYGGRDTHKPLSLTSANLGRQLDEIWEEHPHANIVLIGHSEGGTVAARWAADNSRTDIPVVTLDSMLYGFWPEDRDTLLPAEDIINYCGGSDANNVLVGDTTLPEEFRTNFQRACTRLWSLAGFRSDVSYDWRATRAFGQDGNLAHGDPLTILSAVNRWDIVAPPWWNVSPRSAGNLIVTCREEGRKTGHSCIRTWSEETGVVFAAIGDVVTAAMDAAKDLEPTSPVRARRLWNHSPAQFAGFQTAISVPEDGEIVAVGEWGTGAGADAGTLHCTPADHIAPDRVVVASDQWQAKSYVVFWRAGPEADVKSSRVRVLPYDDTTTFEALVTDTVLNGFQNPCPPAPPPGE
jgi:hypothetical protein